MKDQEPIIVAVIVPDTRNYDMMRKLSCLHSDYIPGVTSEFSAAIGRKDENFNLLVDEIKIGLSDGPDGPDGPVRLPKQLRLLGSTIYSQGVLPYSITGMLAYARWRSIVESHTFRSLITSPSMHVSGGKVTAAFENFGQQCSLPLITRGPCTVSGFRTTQGVFGSGTQSELISLIPDATGIPHIQTEVQIQGGTLGSSNPHDSGNHDPGNLWDSGNVLCNICVQSKSAANSFGFRQPGEEFCVSKSIAGIERLMWKFGICFSEIGMMTNDESRHLLWVIPSEQCRFREHQLIESASLFKHDLKGEGDECFIKKWMITYSLSVTNSGRNPHGTALGLSNSTGERR